MVSGADRTNRDVGGAVGFAVLLFIAFALGAVILLSSTVLSAINIKNNVRKTITPAVTGINSNLNSVPLLDRINAIAGRILGAAQPLKTEADQIVSTTGSINDKTTTIHNSAVSINGAVRSIDGAVGLINGNLGSIKPTVSSIRGTVNSINGAVTSVGSNVDAISSSVGPINTSVNSINGTFSNLLPVVTDIRGVSGSAGPGVVAIADRGTGVAGIDDRASMVIGLANLIKGDTATILGVVPAINANAAAIQNANALQLSNVGLLTALTQAGLGNLLPGLVPKAIPAARPHVVAPAAQPAAVPAAPLPGLPPSLNNGIAPITNIIGALLNGTPLAPNTPPPSSSGNLLADLGLGKLLGGL